MNHGIVIPAINPDNLAGCLDSMNPTVRARVIVVDNTDDGACGHPEGVAAVYSPHRNLGVSAAWNYGARMVFGDGGDFITVCSSSMRFDSDGGVAVTSTADFCTEHRQWLWGFESLNGWHLFTLGRRTWERVGQFDERFWPAYFEDNDYIHRMRCLGVIGPAGAHSMDRKIPWLPWLNYPCETAAAIRSGAVHVDLSELEAFYVEKWGGRPGEETRVAAEPEYGDGWYRAGTVVGDRWLTPR